MKNLFSLVNLAIWMIVGVTFTGCTLDDPTENSGGSSTSGNYRLSSITLMGSRVLSASYDSQNRLTMLDGRYLCGSTIEIEYGPMVITMVTYEDDGYQATEKTIYSNIKLNSQGFIESVWDDSYTYEDGEWVLDGHYENDVTGESTIFVSDSSTDNFYYDSNGRLKQVVISTEADQPTNYTWSNGNLISIDDGEDTMTFTYSSAENKKNQWSPSWGSLIYMTTGLFGNAPANLVSSVTFDGDVVNFAYQQNAAGYIEKEQTTVDGMSLVLTYNYKK